MLFTDVKSRISSKGQVTIPVEVREKLGLRPGTPVQFELREGSVVLKKGSGGVHPVDLVYGIAPEIEPADRLIEAMRGPAPRLAPPRKRKKKR